MGSKEGAHPGYSRDLKSLGVKLSEPPQLFESQLSTSRLEEILDMLLSHGADMTSPLFEWERRKQP